MKLFKDGKFYSMQRTGEHCSSVLVKDGVIVDIFDGPTTVESAEIIELEGRTVVPGLIDTHTHCFEGGLYALGTDLSGASSIKEVLELVKNAQPLGNVVFTFRLDELKLKEKRLPTTIELDSVQNSYPLILRRVDGHSSVINTKAKESMGKEFKVDQLRGRANDYVVNWFHSQVDDEGILKAYHKAAELALLGGHTSIHTMIGDGHSNLTHYKLLEDHLNDFPVEFILYPQISDIDKAISIGASRVGGCILADGSFGSKTAALTKPYLGESDLKLPYNSDMYWEDFFRRAQENSIQVAVHAIGDAAILQLINAIESTQKMKVRNMRHQIIHAELLEDSMIDRIKKADIVLTAQPMFDKLWGGKKGLYESVLGKDRTALTNRFKSLIDAGVTVAGGSDFYVTELNALMGIDAAINHNNESERVTPYDAVTMYTTNAAKVSFDENRIGKIAKGFQADFSVLQEDILKGPITKYRAHSIYKKGLKVFTIV